MSYSTDPVADAAAYYEPRFTAAERQAKAEAQAADDFLSACRKGDANALATFAPMVKDYETARRLQCATADVPKRYETLTEVLQESLDYTNGPCMTELMQLLLNVAYGSDVVNAPAQARSLLQRMADKWAWINTDVEA